MKSSQAKGGVKLLVAAGLVVGVLPLLASPSSAVQFCNTGPITLPNNMTPPPRAANPYPSSITVSGLSGTITDVNLILNDFSLVDNGVPPAYASDIDVMLVGPTGANVVPFSDVGDDNVTAPPPIPASSPLDIILDDQAANALPGDTALSAGSFRPTDDDNDVDEVLPIDQFPIAAPAPSGSTNLSTFNGTAPNGTWQLFVVDDFGGPQTAQFAGGWCVDITTTGGGTTTSSSTPGTSTSTSTSTTSTTTPTTTSTTTPTTTSTTSTSTTSTTSPSTTSTTAPTTTTTAPSNGLICFGQPATIVGTEGDDMIAGTPGNDVIVALGGVDRVDGGGGDDRICGGAGDDFLVGGAGNDMVSGGDGNDRLSGGDGNDNLQGDAGNDTIAGGNGTDTCGGGAGTNALAFCEA